MRRRSWDRKAAYVRKYGQPGADKILQLLAMWARKRR